VWSQQKSSIR